MALSICEMSLQVFAMNQEWGLGQHHLGERHLQANAPRQQDSEHTGDIRA
jgi:hypothetical protein